MLAILGFSLVWFRFHQMFYTLCLQLTEAQRNAITNHFKGKPLPPLYIKLVFDVIVNWKSYTEDLHIPEDVSRCLEQLYNDLEKEHGKFPCKLWFCWTSHLPLQYRL